MLIIIRLNMDLIRIFLILYIRYKMLLKKLTVLLLIVLIAVSTTIAQDTEILERINTEQPDNFYEVKSLMNEYFDSFPDGSKKSGYKQYKRWEWFAESHLNPDGTIGDAMQLLDAYQNSIQAKSKYPKLQSKSWTIVGPTAPPKPRKTGISTGIGRVNAVELHPTNPKELWVAAASGGIWKSADDGATWTSKFPDNDFYTLGANDISISKSNPSIMYAATGDSYGAFSSSGYTSFSIGVIKSLDGGNTWSVTSLEAEITDRFETTRILCHPEDPQLVLVGTSRGIYRTSDGGSSWSNSANNSGNFYDMEMKPGTPNTVYASCYGSNFIRKTTDFGISWTTSLTIPGARRVELAVCGVEDVEVVGAVASSNDNGFNSFWISYDSGENWDKISDRNSTSNVLGWSHIGAQETGDNGQGQGWYDLALEIDPKNYAHIIIGGINLWESQDGGVTFESISHYRGLYQRPYVHADFHDLNYNADGSKLYIANDGGIYSTKNLKEFDDISAGINITQYYYFGSSVEDPTWLTAGAQDNGTVGKQGSNWTMVIDGDGGQCMIDPENKNRWYGSYIHGDMRYSINAGGNFHSMIHAGEEEGNKAAWIAPMALDPLSTNRVLVGFDDVWMSEEFGGTNSWYKISNFDKGTWDDIRTLKVYGELILAATSSRIYACYDGQGFDWTEIVKSGSISDIAIDQTTPNHFWYTISGFSEGNKVFEYNDGTITNLSGNLENIPVHSIAWQPDSPNRLYIGTDIGVFSSEYNTGYWERYGNGLPNTIVSHIEVLTGIEKLRISTYGKGIWEVGLNTCNLPPPTIEALGETEFCPGGSVTLRAVEESSSYLWSTGEKTREITVSKAGFYTLNKVEGECIAKSIPIEVQIFEVDDFEITGKDESAFCEGQNTEVTLKATSGFKSDSYLWNDGTTGKELDVTEPGVYSVTASTNDGCEVFAEFEVKNMPLPDPPVIYQQSSKLSCSSPVAVAWQWYTFDGSDHKKVLGENKQLLEISEDDIGKFFCVEIEDQYGCSIFCDSCWELTTSINELDENESIVIKPNPVNNIANIEMELNESGPVEVSIFDITGNLVYQTGIVSHGGLVSTQVDLSNISTGSYILTVRINDRVYTDTIIKN